MTIQEALQTGMNHHKAGELQQAEVMYRKVLQVQPDNSVALHWLGIIAIQMGQLEPATQLIRQAIAIDPAVADFYINLGVANVGLGRLDEAIESFQKALTIQPESTEALSNLADTYCRKEEWNEAIKACRRALSIRPDLAQAHCNLGVAFQHTGQVAEAITCYQRALTTNPNYFVARHNMGNALVASGKMDQAIACLKQAITVHSNHPLGYNSLAGAYLADGAVTEAVAAYDQSLSINPDPTVASSRIFALRFDPAADSQRQLTECRAWDERYGAQLRRFQQPHENDRTPDRKVRIGFVSSDFRDHPTGRLVLPLFQEHNRGEFEFFAYSSTGVSDAVTDRLRGFADHWHDIRRLNDDQAAVAIRGDQIDILVDLHGHTEGNRLTLMARKPAPLAISFLGGVGTTGLEAIGYRLSDPFIDSPDADLSVYSERTIRLARSCFCYQPDESMPAVAPAPAIENGYVTYGSLNYFPTASKPALDLWAAVLAAKAESRLILNVPSGAARQRVEDHFAARNVSPDRLEFVFTATRNEMVRVYQRVDILLDPIPCNGLMSSCDGLWMGLPLVTLTGPAGTGGVGRSIVSNIGLPELAAESSEQYVNLAADTDRWLQQRPQLRQRMADSPLMDSRGYARDVEMAFREMYHL